MASKKKKSKKGGGKGSGGNKKQAAASGVAFTVMDDNGTFEEHRATDFNQVLKKVAMSYNVQPGQLSTGEFTMQVGDYEQPWQDLTSYAQLQTFAKEKDGRSDDGFLMIRIKELADDDEDLDDYDDEDYNEDDYDSKDDDDDDDEDDVDDYKYDEDYPWEKDEDDDLQRMEDNMEMKDAVQSLIAKLQEDGWGRSCPDDRQAAVGSTSSSSLLDDDFALVNKDNGEQMTARQAVIQCAADLPDLQEVLVTRIGSLDHIATCLQFGFLWDDVAAASSKAENDQSS